LLSGHLWPLAQVPSRQADELRVLKKLVGEARMPDNSEKLSILGDKEILFSMFTEITTNARYSVDKIWENTKFFMALSSALLTTTIALFGVFTKLSNVNIFGLDITLVLTLIPLSIILVSMIGMFNLKREYRTHLERIVIMGKLQEMLGLHEEVESSNYLNDKYLLPSRFIEDKFSSSEEFIELGIKRKGSLYSYFKALHWIYIMLSLIIIAAIVAVSFQ